ncbi:MAG: thymidylate synthase, partial [Pseudomonadota bacterium]|nr:thymidylate synthase [Pseudomonadota bacterium]
VMKGRAALAWCHTSFQFYVIDGRLSCLLYARSQDSFLGTPYNISSYALLIHIVAQQTGMGVGELIWTGGDCHIYANHLPQVDLQLSREPLPLPSLVIKRHPGSIFDYRPEDFELVGYIHHPAISAPVAV